MKKMFKIENRYIKIYIQTDCTHIGYAKFIIYGLKCKYESIKQMNFFWCEFLISDGKCCQ